MKSLTNRICLIAVVILASSCLQAEPDLTGLSKKWITFLKYEWNYNNENRKDDPQDRIRWKKLETSYVYLRANKDIGKTYSSKRSRSRLLKFYDKLSANRKFQPFIFNKKLSTKELKNSKLIATNYRAIKIQGTQTVFIWDSTNRDAEPFYLKPGGGLYSESISILMACLLEGQKIPPFDFLPEMEFASDQYGSYIIRPSASFIEEDQPYQLVPGHGYLNHSHSKKFAEWKLNEFVPRFAVMTAQLNLMFGIYHASHSENIQLRLEKIKSIYDRRAGRLRRIILKDLHDTQADALVFVERKYLTTDHLKNLNFLGNIIWDGEAENRNPEHFIYNYAMQSVAHIFKYDILNIAKALSIFVEEYLAEATKITNQEIKLSRDTYLMKDLLAAEYESEGEITDMVDHRINIGEEDTDAIKKLEYMAELILGDIIEKARRTLLPKNIPPPPDFDQIMLRGFLFISNAVCAILDRNYIKNNPFDKDDIKSGKLLLSHDDHRIFIFERNRKKPAVVFYIPEAVEKEIMNAPIRITASPTTSACGGNMRELAAQ